MRRLLFFLAVLLLVSPPVPAEEREAQRWGAVEEESAIASAGGALPFDNFSSEIYFDPDRLHDSSIILSATFHPPGEAPTEENMLSGTFQSTRIRQVKGNLFEAEGKIMGGGVEQTVKIPFTAAFDKNSPAPKIVIEGAFDANLAAHGVTGESPKYPAQVPLRFRVAATPIPQ